LPVTSGHSGDDVNNSKRSNDVRGSKLVKAVMETSGGDNEVLARKIRERFDRHAASATARPLHSFSTGWS
jgi:hypothetical protein